MATDNISADLTAGRRAQVKVPSERTRESALDTSPPANRPAAVSPMGEARRTRTTAHSPDRGRQRHREVRAKRPRSGTLRRGARSACDSERPITVMHGQSWSLDSDSLRNIQTAFALVRALETNQKLMVRGRGELPTFAFQGERHPASQPLAEAGVADAHPPRCSILSAESAASRPSRTRSLRAR